MTLRDLTPWRARTPSVPATYRDPFDAFRREMDHLFDDFSRGFAMPSLWDGFDGDRFVSPRLDVNETETGYEVSVELPGIEEGDVDVTLADGVLTIKGEKKAESEQKEKGRLHVERSFGSFQRSLALPGDVDESRIEATFKNGVLKLALGKSPETKPEVKKIAIRSK